MIARDVELLHAVARLAERFWPGARRLRPVAVVAEFEKTLDYELDLMREAASAAQLKRNFDDSSKLYVPQIYWDLCRRGVLTMERVHGIPISDLGRLRAQGVNIRRLAENGVEIFFTQVFRHNFFHADMHPGNIFVDASDPECPKYVAVDFGIMGSLGNADQLYLAENFLAFFRRDYRRVAALHVESGWVPSSTRIDELEAAVRTVCEPIFDRPLKEISFGLVLLRLFETARRFDMEVQPQLVLLQKTLLAIEGLGRELYPELDLWTTAKPVLEAWMRERRHPGTQLKRLAESWPRISEDLLALPELLHARVRELRRAEMEATRPKRHRQSQAFDARLGAGSVSLLAGTLWGGLYGEPAWIAWFLLGAGGLLLLLALRRH
jgi:ubiquinone biosynthesis protein